MSSVGTVGNEQYHALLRSQQLSSDPSATLKRSQEDSGLDSGIPSKRMHGMDGNVIQMGNLGTPFIGGGLNDNIVETINIPENTVGLVIGRGGSEIQTIQTQSGCRVQMSPENEHGSGVRQCTLQGTRISVERARQMITDVVSRAQQRQSNVQINPDGSRTVTVDIIIPAAKCGLVIGKQGDTIKQLQEQAGCKMLMIQDSQEVTGKDKPLRLSGDPDKVEMGKRLVNELIIREDNQNRGTFTMEGATAKGEVVVPRSSVGMIIGKGGETIKKLAIETGTKIQFKPDEDPNSSERCAVIMGTREQIYKATELITELVHKSMSNASNNQTQEVFYMHVPANKTGLVIGKGGETIKQINAESGAHCELSRDPPPNGQEKVFIIKGTPFQVHHAQHIIRIKVGDIPPNTPVPALPGSGPMPGSGASFVPSGQFNGSQFGGPMASNQWGASFAAGNPMSGDSSIWNPTQSFGAQAQPAAAHAAFPTSQYQQPQAAPAPVAAQPYQQAQPAAQPAQPVTSSANAQPSINPSTGQPDYSAQWAEYYRSVGLHEQAAMVENQMKQNAAAVAARGSQPVAASQYPSSAYQQPSVVGAQASAANPAAYAAYGAVGHPGFPQAGQFQSSQPQPF